MRQPRYPNKLEGLKPKLCGFSGCLYKHVIMSCEFCKNCIYLRSLRSNPWTLLHIYTYDYLTITWYKNINEASQLWI